MADFEFDFDDNSDQGDAARWSDVEEEEGDEEDEEEGDEEEEGGEEDEDDVHEEDEVPEHERRRRRVFVAKGLRVKKLQALERKDPYSLLPVVHLTDLYKSPRFAHIDAGLRYSILVHVLHHHHLHLLGSDSACDVASTTP